MPVLHRSSYVRIINSRSCSSLAGFIPIGRQPNHCCDAKKRFSTAFHAHVHSRAIVEMKKITVFKVWKSGWTPTIWRPPSPETHDAVNIIWLQTCLTIF
ncbi:hypothetical protein B9Z55_027318 [Caenorhabditis nigoni]|uniref:Uncharacterized protein n=1 Tax=Caenorhabditis nigoni TaxID=1611254 RepID=A0A2G5SGI1_9PELO|nr:hypothetical protein B9Z55_027318 [Caenorhabditis nigoni]